MVKTFKTTSQSEKHADNITADVIILGCTLPGIVTAHKLKKRFGDSMDIVVLDLAVQAKVVSKCNVAFQGVADEGDSSQDEDRQTNKFILQKLADFARDLDIKLPDAIYGPTQKNNLNKLFQHNNGSAVQCIDEYNDFSYLNIVERFELNQYQNLLNENMKSLFQTNNAFSEADRQKLLYYDRTTMEKHICDALIFTLSREIMRITVRLVCAAPADTVSVLFYLHQCYRTNSSRNHLDGNNLKLKEKLLGFCRKRLSSRLQKSVADITLKAKTIREIRTYSEEQVILETMKGETNYICNLLAMALKPDQLNSIHVDSELLSGNEIEIVCSMTHGRAKKFLIQYEVNFWKRDGYSGDILSIRGPIIWAMERPRLSTTGSLERYAALIGYLKVTDSEKDDSKEEVIEQLVKLFGDEAASPINYRETELSDIFVPRCGDYIALRKMTQECSRKKLDWGALDIFADGDVAAAIEAGHMSYLHLVQCLRPQAQTFDDISAVEWPTILYDTPVSWWVSHLNYQHTLRLLAYTAVIYFGVKYIRSYFKK